MADSVFEEEDGLEDGLIEGHKTGRVVVGTTRPVFFYGAIWEDSLLGGIVRGKIFFGGDYFRGSFFRREILEENRRGGRFGEGEGNRSGDVV